MAHTRSKPYQFDKWKYQVFIKIMFKKRKYLRKTLILMAMKDLCFNQVHKYARTRKH